MRCQRAALAASPSQESMLWAGDVNGSGSSLTFVRMVPEGGKSLS